jgi:hypothetical protein
VIITVVTEGLVGAALAEALRVEEVAAAHRPLGSRGPFVDVADHVEHPRLGSAAGEAPAPRDRARHLIEPRIVHEIDTKPVRVSTREHPGEGLDTVVVAVAGAATLSIGMKRLRPTATRAQPLRVAAQALAGFSAGGPGLVLGDVRLWDGAPLHGRADAPSGDELVMGVHVDDVPRCVQNLEVGLERIDARAGSDVEHVVRTRADFFSGVRVIAERDGCEQRDREEPETHSALQGDRGARQQGGRHRYMWPHRGRPRKALSPTVARALVAGVVAALGLAASGCIGVMVPPMTVGAGAGVSRHERSVRPSEHLQVAFPPLSVIPVLAQRPADVGLGYRVDRLDERVVSGPVLSGSLLRPLAGDVRFVSTAEGGVTMTGVRDLGLSGALRLGAEWVGHVDGCNESRGPRTSSLACTAGEGGVGLAVEGATRDLDGVATWSLGLLATFRVPFATAAIVNLGSGPKDP